jgi:NAD(P)H-nitrite reductase large subunit
MNIVEVCHLDVASFGRWDDPAAEVMLSVDPDRPAYRKLLWHDDRLTGAMILGASGDIWTTNDVGMLKGLVQSGVPLGQWKEQLRRNPFDVKRAYVASHAARQLLPQTVLGRAAPAPAVLWS